MYIDLHQTGSVGEGSDHLQLIKYWPSCASGKGVCGGGKMFGSALLQPACSVCISPSAFSFLLELLVRKSLQCGISTLFVVLMYLINSLLSQTVLSCV